MNRRNSAGVFLYVPSFRVARNASIEVAVTKSVLRIRRQQEDLPNAAFLP